MHRIASLCLFWALFAIFSPGLAVEAAAKDCMTGGCHQELTKVKYMHGPVAAEMAGVDACGMCHLPAGAKCTKSRGGTYKLKGQGLCTTCHAKGTSTQHSDMEVESKCLKCHSPHGSDSSRHMLRPGVK